MVGAVGGIPLPSRIAARAAPPAGADTGTGTRADHTGASTNLNDSGASTSGASTNVSDSGVNFSGRPREAERYDRQAYGSRR